MSYTQFTGLLLCSFGFSDILASYAKFLWEIEDEEEEDSAEVATIHQLLGHNFVTQKTQSPSSWG